MTELPLKLPDSGPMTHSMPDGRLSAPSAERNAAVIFERLAGYIPAQGTVLELASGTGQHIASFAASAPDVIWQPSDLSDDRMASVEAWRAHAKVPNLRAAIQFDASGAWPQLPDLGLAYVVNLFHLITHKDALGVIRGAAAALNAGGHFFIYGPFRTKGRFRSDGDAAFHASLSTQNAAIGYKDLEWMQAELALNGLALAEVYEMPANNLAVVARKTG